MLAAFLKGKLSKEQENLEDLLTSTVFGILKYAPAEKALLPFLRLAETPSGQMPLRELIDTADVACEFWPQWQAPGCVFCEPDVVLRVTSAEANFLILIEAKYQSDKSSQGDLVPDTPPTDQLAKEWDNLVAVARTEQASPVLIYMTADLGCPREALAESCREHRLKRGRDAVLAWLSWRHLDGVLANAHLEALSDLRAVLRRLGLTFFGGFSAVDTPGEWSWSFARPIREFNWVAEFVPATWEFHPTPQGERE